MPLSPTREIALGRFLNQGGQMPLIGNPGGGFSFTVPSGGGGGGFNIPGILTGIAADLGGALAQRIAAPRITAQPAMLAPAPAPVARAPQQAVAQNGRCGPCQPRPGPCDPPFIDTDFGAFGANPCSADPRYPRLTMRDGVEVCAPVRRKPRMNPLNPRAAARAARRLDAMGRAVRRTRKAVNKAARSLS